MNEDSFPLTNIVKETIEDNVKSLTKVKYILENEPYSNRDLKKSMLYILKSGRKDLIGLFITYGESEFKDLFLIIAARNKKDTLIKYLLDRGADIHAKDDKALWEACTKGYKSTVNLLIKNGANVDAKNGACVKDVIVYRRGSILQILIEAGADTSKKEFIEIAVQNRDLKIIKMLLENGVSLDNLNPIFFQNMLVPRNDILSQEEQEISIKIINLLYEHNISMEILSILLKEAIRYNNLIIAKTLIDLGTEIQDSFIKYATSKEMRDLLRSNIQALKNEEDKEEKENNPIVGKLCMANDTLGGDPLKDTDDFVVFLIQTEGEEEKGECYLRSELQQVAEKAPDVSLWEGPPSGTAYKGPMYITGEKPVPYPGKRKEGINNKVYRLPWTGTWVTNAVIQRALFSGDLIIVLGGENMSIGSSHGSGQMHGQYGGHWGYLDGNPGEAVYFEDGDFQPDERIPVYDVIDSYR